MRPVLALLPLLLLAACGGPLASGVARYDEARYPEALAELRAAERGARDAAPAERARYALYRGLAHLAVGDVASARPWLAEARRRALAAPALLDDADAGRLASAWAHLPE